MFQLITITLFLIIFVLGASFAAVNTAPVTIDYYLGSLTLPLAMVVISSIVLGIIFGTVLLATSTLKLKYEHRRLSKKVTALEQEIDALNALPVQDSEKDNKTNTSTNDNSLSISNQQTP